MAIAHVLDRGERAEQVVLLKDEADVLAELDLLPLRAAHEVLAQDIKASLLHSPQGADQGQQGRFSRARRPCHDHDLALADLEVVVEKDLGPGLAAAVGIVHILCTDHQVSAGGLHHGHVR